MAARRPGDARDVERRRGDVVTGVEATAIGVFDAGVDFDDGLDVLKARLARIAFLGFDPIDLAGGGVGAGLDAAMGLLDGGLLGDEFGGGGGTEIVRDIGFQRRLVAFEGEQIIGLVGTILSAMSA